MRRADRRTPHATDAPPRPARAAGANPALAPGTPSALAIPELLERHGARLFSLASRLCGNTADAEDMVQGVFLQALRKWPTFRGESSAGTWLYAIAARSCKARLRRKGGIDPRMPAFSQLMPWNETTNLDLVPGAPPRDPDRGRPAADAGPVAAAIKRESTRAIHEAILALPEHFRVPLVLKEMLELSIDDVAAALQLKPQTVKTRIHRARLLLRKAIIRSRNVPTKPAATLAYEKQVCLDLLRAKLDAMDNGRGFPIGRDVLCDRCRAVFAELDLTQDACAQLSNGTMPARVRNAICTAIRRAASA